MTSILPLPLGEIPAANARCWHALYCLENGLRELIIEELTAVAGEHWYRDRLPPDVLKGFREGREYERKLRWFEHTPHHPIYYVDFPDLRKVIARSDNWEQAFKKILANRNMVASTLEDIEPIRNSVAHNRKLRTEDAATVESALAKILRCVGEARFCALLSRSTSVRDIPAQMQALLEEVHTCLGRCMACEHVAALPVWDRLNHCWWFDDDYLGQDLTSTRLYFRRIRDYVAIPRSRGTGHRVQAWVRKQGLPALADAAGLEIHPLTKAANPNA